MTNLATCRMCVHLFGATLSPGCANFGLKQITSDDESALRKDFYVDDGLKSDSSVEEAVEIINRSQTMCMNGGLRLSTSFVVIIRKF